MKSFAIPKEFWPHCPSRRLIRCFVCLEPPVRSQVRERQQHQQTLWNRGPFSRLFFLLLQRTSRVCLTHVKEVRVPSMPQSETWKRIQITVSWQVALTSYDLNSWCFLFFSKENINYLRAMIQKKSVKKLLCRFKPERNTRTCNSYRWNYVQTIDQDRWPDLYRVEY